VAWVNPLSPRTSSHSRENYKTSITRACDISYCYQTNHRGLRRDNMFDFRGRRFSRRDLLRRGATILPALSLFRSFNALAKIAPAGQQKITPGFSFTDIAHSAGLSGAVNVYGGVARKQYILEEVGNGVALFDYDNDGWLDIFFVNGTRFEEVSPHPTNFLFRN